MTRLLVFLAFVVLALDIFAIIDVILVERRRVRALNKALWVLLVLLLPGVGAVLWFTIGKAPRDPREPAVYGPDDDPTFMRKLGRDEELDERIRRLEQELADLDDDPPKE